MCASFKYNLLLRQHDLTYTRSELEKWTAHLSELRDVMESVDVDTLEEMVEEDWNVAATGQVPSSIMEDSKYLDMLMVSAQGWQATVIYDCSCKLCPV